MNKIKWIIFAAMALGILGYLIFMNKSSKIDVNNIDINVIQMASDKNGNIADNLYGKADSNVTLIEYADFQCPGCAAANPTVKKLVEQYKDKIRFVFRDFPLTSIHPNAKAAAGATQAAGLQGKYWEMHDKIYENQSAWSKIPATERIDFFAKYATDLGLDAAKFSSDIASKSVSDKIAFDTALGIKANVKGTPSFYLNGNTIDSEITNMIINGDSSKLAEAIEKELSKN